MLAKISVAKIRDVTYFKKTLLHRNNILNSQGILDTPFARLKEKHREKQIEKPRPFGDLINSHQHKTP
jgi:hypothetical protein